MSYYIRVTTAYTFEVDAESAEAAEAILRDQGTGAGKYITGYIDFYLLRNGSGQPIRHCRKCNGVETLTCRCYVPDLKPITKVE